MFKSGEWVKLILYGEVPLRDPAPHPSNTRFIEKIPRSYFRY